MAEGGGGRMMDYEQPWGKQSSRTMKRFSAVRDQLTFYIANSPREYQERMTSLGVKYGTLKRQLEDVLASLQELEIRRGAGDAEKVLDALAEEHLDLVSSHATLLRQKKAQEGEHVKFIDTDLDPVMAEFDQYSTKVKEQIARLRVIINANQASAERTPGTPAPQPSTFDFGLRF